MHYNMTNQIRTLVKVQNYTRDTLWVQRTLGYIFSVCVPFWHMSKNNLCYLTTLHVWSEWLCLYVCMWTMQYAAATMPGSNYVPLLTVSLLLNFTHIHTTMLPPHPPNCCGEFVHISVSTHIRICTYLILVKPNHIAGKSCCNIALWFIGIVQET